jgi:hypothetical protein
MIEPRNHSERSWALSERLVASVVWRWPMTYRDGSTASSTGRKSEPIPIAVGFFFYGINQWELSDG